MQRTRVWVWHCRCAGNGAAPGRFGELVHSASEVNFPNAVGEQHPFGARVAKPRDFAVFGGEHLSVSDVVQRERARCGRPARRHHLNKRRGFFSELSQSPRGVPVVKPIICPCFCRAFRQLDDFALQRDALRAARNIGCVFVPRIVIVWKNVDGFFAQKL